MERAVFDLMGGKSIRSVTKVRKVDKSTLWRYSKKRQALKYTHTHTHTPWFLAVNPEKVQMTLQRGYDIKVFLFQPQKYISLNKREMKRIQRIRFNWSLFSVKHMSDHLHMRIKLLALPPVKFSLFFKYFHCDVKQRKAFLTKLFQTS